MTALLVRDRVARYGRCADCGRARSAVRDTVPDGEALELICPYCGAEQPKVGAWWRNNQFMTLTEIASGYGRVLRFDPPSMLFLDGGMRLAIEDYDGPNPVLLVDHWRTGSPHRYPLRRCVQLRRAAS